jgi:putative transposase
VIVAFVDEHRDEFGVEPICTTLQVAPSTYYAGKRRQLAPSARAVRDAALMQILMVLWVANRKVYGAHKLWKAARRAGHDVGRDQVARLMRAMESRESVASGARCSPPARTPTRCEHQTS